MGFPPLIVAAVYTGLSRARHGAHCMAPRVPRGPTHDHRKARNFTDFRNRAILRRRYHYCMGLGSVLSIAVSGMTAAERRLEVSASNVANALSSGPLPDASAAIKASYPPAYIAQRVDQVEAPGGGTIAIVGSENPGAVPVYDPSAPYANGQGLVATPNVDFANEAIQQLMAKISFQSNAFVVRTYDQMMKTLLDIGSPRR
jgi:flagellar basal-body rod protein FlgC